MTHRQFNPHPYQRLIIGHQSEIDRSNVRAGMALGKTVSTLTTLEALYHFGIETQPTLVCAPLRSRVRLPREVK